MTGLQESRTLLAQVDQAGGCTHPVRLTGSTLDHGTGEMWEGTVPVACKDRRSAVCPACAARYRSDAWHLVAAGLQGGKGVPETVAGHPAVFATLTAPSFGPVHARRTKGPCHPRRQAPLCRHGAVLACTRVHGSEDPLVGEPLCAECFAYAEAVLWNAHAGRLFNRTVVVVRRSLAAAGGLSERAARGHLRLSYLKVAEFQRRGLVHFHVVARVDGPEGPQSPPPAWATTEVLASALEAGVEGVTVARVGGGGRIGWGTEFSLGVIGETKTGGPSDPGAVAAYVAKYSTKGSEASGALVHPVRSEADPAMLRLRPHLARLVTTAWRLGGERDLATLRLRAHAHTFGFSGHFATKSFRYSTTFRALREARAAYRGLGRDRQGAFFFVGRGYPDPKADLLAEALSEAADTTHRPPGKFPGSSPRVPQPADQG